MTESTSSGCVFCAIASGRIPARVVHDEEDLLGFEDLNPQAPTHLLFIPRRHVASVDELVPGDELLVGRLVLAAGSVARRLGLDRSGYRLILNTGEDGGQSVFHLHLHLLGGRPLGWPPG
jgi:histidine triad (HIT) family protein